jgi:hypothetical protein
MCVTAYTRVEYVNCLLRTHGYAIRFLRYFTLRCELYLRFVLDGSSLLFKLTRSYAVICFRVFVKNCT